MIQTWRFEAPLNGGLHMPIFFLIVGVPFVIVLVAFLKPHLLEQVIQEPPGRTPPS
jgi:hypothetical protein